MQAAFLFTPFTTWGREKTYIIPKRLFYNAIFGYLEYRMWYQNTNGGRRHESIISTLNNERHKGLSIINALLWPLISSILGR